MTKGLSEPHILLASSNSNRLVRNLEGILTRGELKKIQLAVYAEVKGLFDLGLSHYNFAILIDAGEWRQRASRLYYAAYNVKRAIQLCHSGAYSTDSSDHQKIDEVPAELENAATYRAKLKNMRDDRNLADYSHSGRATDLLLSPSEMERLVTQFIADARKFLTDRGVVL